MRECEQSGKTRRGRETSRRRAQKPIHFAVSQDRDTGDDEAGIISFTGTARRREPGMDESAERWISRQELADRYGVPVKTPAVWASKGTGPPFARFGRHVRYRLCDVIAWEREQLRRAGHNGAS
jgi:hypothetical protein